MNDDVIIYINGQQLPEVEARMQIKSEAFLQGFAVFETLRTYRKQVFRLKEHLTRLRLSAEEMKIATSYTDQAIEKQMLEMLERCPWEEVRLRMILTHHELILMGEKLKEKEAWMYQSGVKLMPFEGQRNLPSIKTLANPLSALANKTAKEKGFYDALLVNEEGWVRECAYANIFWVKSGILYTNEKAILKGVTRQIVLSLAEKYSLEEIRYKDLIKAEEIFITQTSSGILPVTQINNKKIGESPGHLTKSLMDQFLELAWGTHGLFKTHSE